MLSPLEPSCHGIETVGVCLDWALLASMLVFSVGLGWLVWQYDWDAAVVTLVLPFLSLWFGLMFTPHGAGMELLRAIPVTGAITFTAGIVAGVVVGAVVVLYWHALEMEDGAPIPGLFLGGAGPFLTVEEDEEE